MMTPISIAGVASHFPEQLIDNQYFFDETTGKKPIMFRGSKSRYHLSPEDTSAEMIEKAAKKLSAKLDFDMAEVDIILTHVTLPDLPFTGCGADVAQRLGAKSKWVVDVNSAGCVSFVYMMALAQSLMTTSNAKTALICNVQTAAGRIYSHPENRTNPQASVPGDGCGVALLVADDSRPVKAIVTKCFPEFSGDMTVASNDGRKWWEPGEVPFHIDFSEAKVAKVFARGNRMVPEVIRATCDQAQMKLSDIDALVTNQPNPIFLRNWREACLLPKEAHVQTFEEHGNLFGAALPICLERGLETGQIKANDNVVLAGFSHAGDFAAGAIVEWRAA